MLRTLASVDWLIVQVTTNLEHSVSNHLLTMSDRYFTFYLALLEIALSDLAYGGDRIGQEAANLLSRLLY